MYKIIWYYHYFFISKQVETYVKSECECSIMFMCGKMRLEIVPNCKDNGNTDC